MSTFTHHPRGDWPFTFDPTRTYEQVDYDMKPKGFWLSVDDDWRRWCKGDGMDDWVDGITPVEFDVDTNACLWLDTAEAIDRFHAEHHTDHFRREYYIDWRPVADTYAGIIIAPYQWSRRLDGPSWYYTWDCASACVWDLSVLRVSDFTGPVLDGAR